MYDPSTWETTPPTMSLRDIVERHIHQVAFLWHQRDAAIRSPVYELEALERLDDRIDANLDGLLVAGDVGWEVTQTALAHPGGGEVFAATVLAVRRDDVRLFAEVLGLGARSPDLSRAIVSGLGWIPLDRVRRFLGELLQDDAAPELHYLGIAGAAVHRYDPGVALAYAAHAEDVVLRARAFRAIGELGRLDLLPVLLCGLKADDEGVRFWAAWSGVLLGEQAVVDVLWQMSRERGRFAERACSMAARVGDPARAIQQIDDLVATGAVRVALAGAATLGALSMVPFLMNSMQSVEHARFAGLAFTMLTGAALRAEQLAGPTPEGFRAGPTEAPDDPNVTLDRDAGLPWPEVEAIQAWWERKKGALGRFPRLLLGKPPEEAWLLEVLASGSQLARASAAIGLVMKSKGKPLFEVRAPGLRQRRLLAEG